MYNDRNIPQLKSLATWLSSLISKASSRVVNSWWRRCLVTELLPISELLVIAACSSFALFLPVSLTSWFYSFVNQVSISATQSLICKSLQTKKSLLNIENSMSTASRVSLALFFITPFLLICFTSKYSKGGANMRVFDYHCRLELKMKTRSILLFNWNFKLVRFSCFFFIIDVIFVRASIYSFVDDDFQSAALLKLLVVVHMICQFFTIMVLQ